MTLEEIPPAPSPRLRVAIYAMGGGHGHAMRGMAVARALQEAGHPAVQCLLLIPSRLRDWAHLARVPSASPPTFAHRDAQALGQWVRGVLGEFTPDVLVVDVFPRGILGELAEIIETLAPRRILVTRWVNPRYYLQTDITLFLRRSYQKIVWTEPPHPDLETAFSKAPGMHRSSPVVFVRLKDMQSDTSCRQYYGIHELQPAVVALGSGDRQTEWMMVERLQFLSQKVRPRFTLIFFSQQLEPQENKHTRIVSAFPAGAWLKVGRVVVAAAGYQSYYEIVQSGLPAVFWPQDRLLDDQLRRARGEMGTPGPARSRVATEPVELEQALGELLAWRLNEHFRDRGDLSADLRVPTLAPPAFNGAYEIARMVLDGVEG